MPKLEYVCPECGGTFLGPSVLQGRSFPCPLCDEEIDRWPAPRSKTTPPETPLKKKAVPPPAPPKKKSARTSLACPECGHVDTVRKISAVVRKERSKDSSLFTDGFTISAWSLKDMFQSDLGERLACPTEPTKPSPAALGWVVGILVFFLVFGIVTLIDKDPKAKDARPGFFLIISILGVIAFLKAREFTKATKRYQIKKERWDEAIEFWENGYYCERCDGVFRSGDAELSDPDEVLRVP
ncbi:MAG: hypothetical protein N2112_03020 [Gemmataceae bacterium]|jgi:DNA-directed RNA polymerase subunit RPC12/RpoP|nr:hypothetical protein [Gemmataceae bacterium]